MPSSSKLDKLLSATRQAAEALAKSAAGCGVVGIEAAGGVVVVILRQLETVKENADACTKLIDELAGLTTVLEGAVSTIGPVSGGNHAMGARLGSEEEFKIRVDGLLAVLRQVQADVLKLVTAASKNKITKIVTILLSARDRKELLKNLADTVNRAKNQFSFRNSVAIETIVRNLEAKVVREAGGARLAREQDRIAREQDRLARAQEAENARLAEERARQEQEWKDFLRRLARASANAEYSSLDNVAGPPLKGTRVALLAELDEWATHASSSEPHFPFYVLTGGAGTGKSTIAYEVARRAAMRRDRGENGQLAASFFFTRGSAGLDSVDTVFSTLARQMLINLSALWPAAISVIEEYVRLGERPKLEIQADHLFVRLLSKLPPNHPSIVIVIDAVDECTVLDHAKHMLSLIMHGLSQLTSSVRVFVSSRPEIHVEHALRSPPFAAPPDSPNFVAKLQRFRLHEIPQHVVDRDIQLYFEIELRKLHMDDLFRNRPVIQVAQELTTISAGLFIYATTLIQYLRLCAQEGSVPDLAQLAEGAHAAPKLALERLGKLYAVVLDQAPLGASDPENALVSMNAVLGYIAVLQDHLSPNALIALSSPDLRQHILPTLRRLAPVLSFYPENPDLPVRPLHASFVDFLLDSTRCNAKYLVSAPEQHLRLAVSSLRLLTVPETIMHYTSYMKRSSRVQSSVHNVYSSRTECVPSAVQYASVYWPAHVICQLHSCLLPKCMDMHTRTGTLDLEVKKFVHEFEDVSSDFFLPEHILYWLEVLAYLHSLGTALHWLPILRRIFLDLDKPLANILYDTYRLVVTFYPAIAEDPRQLYISALPQCPDTSPLRPCIPRPLAVPRSLLPYPTWSPWITRDTEQLPEEAWEEEDYRWLIRPSPDGQWVAASLRSGRDRRGNIQLRDAATGIILKTLYVDPIGLADFGISSDSRFVVSATVSGRIRITDCSSGHVVAAINHSDGDITRVAFGLDDSDLLVVHAHQNNGYDHPRPVHFLVLEWDPTARPEGRLWPKWESHGLRGHGRPYSDGQLWSISPNGRWGILWATGDLLDLHSFDEARLSFIPNTTAPWYREAGNVGTCGTWLSATSFVCSIPHEDGCCLLVVDIGQTFKGIETRPMRSLPTRYRVNAMQSSSNGSLVALHGTRENGVHCICVWDPNGDEIHFVKYVYECDFGVSPLGDTLYLTLGSTWSVIPTSQSSIATQHPLHPTALKFSATHNTIMVATLRPADRLGWEAGIFSRRFPSSPAFAVSRHYFNGRPSNDACLTPDPKVMIFTGDKLVLHATVGRIQQFAAASQHQLLESHWPEAWHIASMSPNLSRTVACGFSQGSSGRELCFTVWDTASARLRQAFRTPPPSLPDSSNNPQPSEEIVVTDSLDIYYLLDHYSFAYPHSDWCTSDPDELRLLPVPEPGPVPDEWFQIGDDGWVTRSDAHPDARRRGQDRLFWIPPSQRVGKWRGDHSLLAMTTEHDVIVLDLSNFDDDSKEQHVRRV